jgi:gliding motility-associated-like protein
MQDFMRVIFTIATLLFLGTVQAQYPDARLFHTAAAGVNDVLNIGSLDTNWTSAIGDTIGPLEPWLPSIVTGDCTNGVWHTSDFPNAEWITYSGGSSCWHGQLSCVDIFFRRVIPLPPVSQCGQYVGDNFCMSMDFYADNDVSHIWVNGVLNHVSNTPNPYYAYGFTNKSTVNLCNGWKSGDNELIVHVKSCPGAFGFLAQVTLNANPGLGTVITSFESKKICAGSSFMGHTTSGVYLDTLAGQNGACDTVHALVLDVGKTYLFYDYAQICPGQSYLGYTQPGWYVDTFPTVSGCDSVRMLNIEAFPASIKSDTVTICVGQIYQGNSTTGIYRDTLQTTNGCDSILVTHLNVVNTIMISDSVTICQGQSYQGYTLAGIYRDTTTSIKGCDSIHALILTQVPYFVRNTSAQICVGQSYFGHILTGQYVDTIPSINECDTIQFTELTVLPSILTNFSGMICSGDTFMGYAQAGVYRDTLVSAQGCDSVRVVAVSVFAPQEQQITTKICAGEAFLGHQVAGMYRDTLRSSQGCDSLVLLTDLTVMPVYQDSQQLILCDGDYYLHSGDTIRVARLVIDSLLSGYGCDSIVSRQLLKSVFQPFLPTDTLLCAVQSFQILSTQPSVFWPDGSSQGYYEVTADGVYFATYTDTLGCTYTDSISIEFIHSIYTPNVFWPFSTLNSHFHPFFINSMESYQLEIYDRWGELIFRTLDIEPGWDGKSRGTNANPGVYAYLVRYQMAGCEPQVFSGDVTLIR